MGDFADGAEQARAKSGVLTESNKRSTADGCYLIIYKGGWPQHDLSGATNAGAAHQPHYHHHAPCSPTRTFIKRLANPYALILSLNSHVAHVHS